MKDDALPVAIVSDEVLNELYDFLESDQVDPEALDVVGLHGFMVALAVCPDSVPVGEWLPIAFNGMPSFSDVPEANVISWLDAMLQQARTTLYRGQTIELPFELQLEPDDVLEDSEVSAWCAGFIEAVMLREEIWFSQHEQDAAELLLPFMAISCLFPDEDLDDMVSDLDMTNRLAEQLPELLVDLYLLFNAPPEKPAHSASGKNSSRSGKSKSRNNRSVGTGRSNQKPNDKNTAR